MINENSKTLTNKLIKRLEIIALKISHYPDQCFISKNPFGTAKKHFNDQVKFYSLQNIEEIELEEVVNDIIACLFIICEIEKNGVVDIIDQIDLASTY